MSEQQATSKGRIKARTLEQLQEMARAEDLARQAAREANAGAVADREAAAGRKGKSRSA